MLFNRWISNDPRVFDETARLLGIKLDLPDAERVNKNRDTVERCIGYVRHIVDVKYQDLVNVHSILSFSFFVTNIAWSYRNWTRTAQSLLVYSF